jgi:hypothetical protein
MAAFNKYNQFVEDFANKVHDLFGTAGSTADVLKVMLSNTAPNGDHACRARRLHRNRRRQRLLLGRASATNVGTRSGDHVDRGRDGHRRSQRAAAPSARSATRFSTTTRRRLPPIR